MSYTRGKSLIFWAYDLDQQTATKTVNAFQAWGRRGPDQQEARSRAKVRNVMRALFNHAMRHELAERNPITLACQSAKGQRTPDILDVNETKARLSELEDPFWTMVFLAGLRVSELLGLKWLDISFNRLEIHVSRAIVDGVIGDMKTEASRKPLALDSALAEVLVEWRGRTPNARDEDWVFASPEKLGQHHTGLTAHCEGLFGLPLRVLESSNTSAGTRLDIRSATLLKANGEDVKVVQESLRHANSRITLDVYTQGLMPTKRQAHGRVVKSFLAPNGPTPATSVAASA